MRMQISEADKIQIERLRNEVKDEISPYYDTDFNLLRWLKGHNYNFNVIVPKLKNHLRFRASRWKLDEVAQKPRDHPIHSCWKSGLTGPAGKTPNAIVNIEQSGTNDYWGMFETYSVNEILKARVHDLETMQKMVMDMESRTGEQASILYFMDLNGLKYDRRLLSLMTGALASISSFMSEHYVELIHTFVLVHAPSFITSLWTIAKPLLPERTRNKVKIFGSNWRHDVLTIADPEALPSYWNEPGSDGSTLRWSVTADGNFAYSMYCAKDESETNVKSMKNVYPIFMKVPGPTIVPLEDEIVCQESGVYKMWFSNEHAWLHTLKVQYTFEVTPADDDSNK